MLKRLVWLSIVLVQIVPITAFAELPTSSTAPSKDWKEVQLENEEQQFTDAANMVNRLQAEEAKRSGDPIERGFHKKFHGTMEGEFQVLDNLPDYCKFGMFKEPKTFKSWIRFSNGLGFSQRDRRADIRGFAFKVVGVQGEKLLANEADATTQDFTFHNNPQQLARDTKQIMALATSGNNPLNIFPHLVKTIGWKEATRITTFLFATTSRHVASVALESYWSGGAISLGPYAVKYFLKPDGNDPQSYRPFGPTDYLRQELMARFKKSDVKFGFYLQFYTDPTHTPIEDDTIAWKEDLSPPVKVGELIMHKRDMEAPEYKTAEAFGNTLAWTPWHGLKDMRPLGHMNRSRLKIYESSASLRLKHHSKEPDGTETFAK